MDDQSSDDTVTVGGSGFKSTLLVVGKDIGFSEMLTSYAIDMSCRMGYSVLAINLYHYLGLRKFFSERTIDIADEDELREARNEGVTLFRTLCEEHNIEFDAQARVGELDEVLGQLHKERDDIDLVILEPEYVDEEEEGPRSIPAFSLAATEK